MTETKPEDTTQEEASPQDSLTNEEHLEDAEAEAQEPQAEDVDSTEDELEKTKDQLLRTLAELENTRKRSQREKQETAEYAVTKFAREILSVVDNLERALAATEGQEDLDPTTLKLIEGIEITRKDLFNTLEKFQIKPVDALEKSFDPNFHQAMFEVPDAAQEPGKVIQEVQKGFTIGNRLLRPAMVGVTKKP